jgi:hypothetical protein
MKTNYSESELIIADELISNLLNHTPIDLDFYSRSILEDLEFRGWIKLEKYENGKIIAVIPSRSLHDKLRQGTFSKQYNK